MTIRYKDLIITAGIAALSVFAPKAATAQSTKNDNASTTGVSDWRASNRQTRYVGKKAYVSAFKNANDVEIPDAKAAEKNEKSEAVKMVKNRANDETIVFGYNETEFAYLKYRMLCISKGAELTPMAQKRIASYLATDTVTFDNLMKEFFLANEFAWRQKLQSGDTVDVLSHKQTLPGTIAWRPNVCGQNAFRVIISDENRKEIARELCDDIRFNNHGVGPIKYEWYPSKCLECKLNGSILFKLFTLAAQELKYKLRQVDLLREQEQVMGQQLQLPEQYMR